ncbi:zuotin [Starmerella bacillaris]|uniref:Zuotin n=1 Tax=Starmerella bacillaris TaxID=1247836 RepID=A0AAV5RGM1_STABA|nr:zuotin [Starmerella bacillaris]
MSFKAVEKISKTVGGKIEPVGPAFLAHARRLVRNRTWSEQETIDAEEKARRAAGEVKEDDGLVDEDADEELLNHDPKDWKNADQYAALGLSNLRWKATPEQIVKAHRRQVLKYHPDKQAASGNSNDGFFKIIQKAFEVVSNPTTRRQWDSVDKKANVSVPKKHAHTDFYHKWTPVFESEARFSVKQPVPGLGTAESSKPEVDAFYSFWYAFDSWRSFEWLDEDVPDDSSNRDNKRYIEKKNKAARVKHKKEDNARLRKLVDTCLSEDPRILAFKEAEKKAKEQRKWEREASTREAAEKEKKAKEEAEKQALEAATAAASAKKNKEQAKNAKKKNKRAIRGTAKEFESLPSPDSAYAAADIDALIESLDDLQLGETAAKVAGLDAAALTALFTETLSSKGVNAKYFK